MLERSRLVCRTLLMLLLLLGVLLAGCGEETASTPPPEINVDEVPVIGNTEAEEPGDEPAEQPAEEPAEEEAPAETASAPEAVTAEEPVEPAPVAEEAPRGIGARIWGGLKAFLSVIGKIIFVLILPAAVAGSLLGMPGGVLVLADAILFSAFHGWIAPPWWVLLILLVLAVAGEAAEHVLSFAGVKQSGASNATGVWVMGGGFVGAVLGGLIAPLLATIGGLAGPVGWIILSIVPPIGLGLVGGYLGGYYYELRSGKTPEEAKIAGRSAMIGRLTGSFTKALLVAVMAAIVLISTWGELF